MKIIIIIISFLPSIFQIPLRKLLGQKIGKGSKIRFGTIIISKSLELGENCTIGPFSYLSAKKITIGNSSVIKPFTIISATEVRFENYVHIAPLAIISGEHTKNSFIKIGDHSRVFPFCWIDTGEGVEIGKHVGIGGHSLIFTHGVWSDYLDGGPISYGKVTIHDNVWLPWQYLLCRM